MATWMGLYGTSNYWNFTVLSTFLSLLFAVATDIGPYSKEAGIFQRHFTQDGPDFPLHGSIKNGLVLELHSYVMTELAVSRAEFVRMLVKITGIVGANEVAVTTFVVRLVEQEKKIKRKGKAYLSSLNDLEEGEFLLVRSRTRKTPDTPRKKKLRQELAKVKDGNKGVKRKLVESEARVVKLESIVNSQTCIIESLEEGGKRETEAEVDRLSSNLAELQKQHETLLVN